MIRCASDAGTSTDPDDDVGHPMYGAAAAAHSRGVRQKPPTPTEGSASTMNDIRHSFAQQGLIRPQEGRVLGGVVAGLGRRFGIAPWPARLLFVLLLMVIPGSPILIYPTLWILMPSEDTLTVQPPRVTPTPAT